MFLLNTGDHLSFHVVSTQETAALNQPACKSCTFKENWKSSGVQRNIHYLCYGWHDHGSCDGISRGMHALKLPYSGK
jgi:hypothetical protein